MIPELVKKNVEKLVADYCCHRINRIRCPHVHLEYHWFKDGIQIDCRDGCNSPWPVARFQYIQELQQWFLYSRIEQQNWRPCLDIRPTLDFQKLLQHLDEDPFRLFWPPSFTCLG